MSSWVDGDYGVVVGKEKSRLPYCLTALL